MQKRQKLTCFLVGKSRDFCGVWEVTVLVNGKEYTYPVGSEFAVRKVESLLRRRKPGKALNVLRLFKTKGFNSFEEEPNAKLGSME